MKLFTRSLSNSLKYSVLVVTTVFLSALPVAAADRITLKFGFLEKTVSVEELETFATTGELSKNLKPYGAILNGQARDLLQKRLYIDPFIARQFLDDILHSPDGKALIEQLKSAFPNGTPDELRLTVKRSFKRSANISVLNIFKAYPRSEVSLDLGSLMNIATQLNKTRIQTEIIEPQLTSALKTDRAENLSLDLSPEKNGDRFVYHDTVMFRDRNRERNLVTDIYSTVNNEQPLIVMSHGFAADRKFLKYLAYHLASHGFTVVSIEHPGSNINSIVNLPSDFKIKNLLPKSEFIDRPKDVSFILDELEKINDRPGYFRGKLNTEKVMIVGHSFGGYTALALAGARLNPGAVRRFCQNLKPLERSPADWLQCSAAELPYKQMWLQDHRIARAIVLNPIVGYLFNQDLADVKIPTLFLSSTGDGITPILSHQIQPFQQLKGDKYLLVAAGATHMSVTDISYLNSTMGQSTLVREVMDAKAEPLRKAIRGLSLAFAEQLTPKGPLYKPYLTPDYVESLSSQYISLRLTKTMPSSLNVLIGMLTVGQPRSIVEESTTVASWGEKLDEYVFNFGKLFSPPEYHTGQLQSVFGQLLRHYDREIREWG